MKKILLVGAVLLLIAGVTYGRWIHYGPLLSSGDLPDKVGINMITASSATSKQAASSTTSKQAKEDLPGKTEKIKGPGTYKNAELGFSFSYSDWWTREAEIPPYLITLWHTETFGPATDIPGKGNSKIEISVTKNIASFLTSPEIEKPIATTIAGQPAYSSTGDQTGVGQMYYIQIPKHPGTYVSFVIFGYGTKAELDKVVNTIVWN